MQPLGAWPAETAGRTIPGMMIVMNPQATSGQIARVVGRLEETGTVHARVVPGANQVAIAALGDVSAVRELGLEAYEGVDSLAAISRPYKLASSELSGHTASIFDICGRTVGPETFTLIAGPCTVESREQTLRVADAVAPYASMLRGGARGEW